jgi:hypothetical protein
MEPFPLGSSEEKQTKLADMALMSYAGDLCLRHPKEISLFRVGTLPGSRASASVLYLLNGVLELWSEVKIIAEINKPGAKARLSY